MISEAGPLSPFFTRLVVLATLICVLSLTHEAHGRVVLKDQCRVWNGVAEKQVRPSFVKRSLFKSSYQNRSPIRESEEVSSTVHNIAKNNKMESSRKTLNIGLFQSSTDTKSRPLRLIRPKGARVQISRSKKWLSTLACGADCREYKLEDFDESSMAGKGLLTDRDHKYRIQDKDIKPIHRIKSVTVGKKSSKISDSGTANTELVEAPNRTLKGFFKSSTATKSRPSGLTNSKSAILQRPLGKKLLSTVACGASSKTQNLDQFDAPSFRSLVDIKHKNKEKDVRPINQKEPATVDAKLAKFFDTADANEELTQVPSSPTSSYSGSETSSPESECRESFRFHGYEPASLLQNDSLASAPFQRDTNVIWDYPASPEHAYHSK
ncbi:hypothetical protein DFH28DRAFT_370030 [Melampsora americana]|nr:hypothetical protein DFH28DRAFT_370030 [Melampsora americana]